MKKEQIEQMVADLISPDDEVRKKAWYGLMEIGEPAVPYMIKALESDNKRMQRIAVNMLCMPTMQAPEAVLPLTVALKDTESLVRLIAAQALSRQEDTRAYDALIAALDDENGVVRGQVMVALSILKHPQVFDIACKMLAEEDDIDARSGAAMALARSGDPRALDLLIEYLHSANKFDRFYAAQAMAWTADIRAFPALEEALNDVDKQVRAAARIGIRRITEEAEEKETEQASD